MSTSPSQQTEALSSAQTSPPLSDEEVDKPVEQVESEQTKRIKQLNDVKLSLYSLLFTPNTPTPTTTTTTTPPTAIQRNVATTTTMPCRHTTSGVSDTSKPLNNFKKRLLDRKKHHSNHRHANILVDEDEDDDVDNNTNSISSSSLPLAHLSGHSRKRARKMPDSLILSDDTNVLDTRDANNNNINNSSLSNLSSNNNIISFVKNKKTKSSHAKLKKTRGSNVNTTIGSVSGVVALSTDTS